MMSREYSFDHLHPYLQMLSPTPSRLKPYPVGLSLCLTQKSSLMSTEAAPLSMEAAP
jgi:hypothetical protein